MDGSFIKKHISKADLFLESLNYDSAEIYYLKVIPSLKDKGNWGLYCSIVNKYVTTLWQQGNLVEAEKIARGNLDDCYHYLGSNDPISGDCLLNIGATLFLTGQAGMTTEYFKKAIHVYEKSYGHWHTSTAKAYEWLGTAHESVSDTTLSYYYLSESKRIWTKVKGVNHTDLGDIYRYLGLYYKRFGKLDSAIHCFNQSKVLFDKKYSVNNYKSVKCLNNICDIYEALGNFDTAFILYNQALELIKNDDAPNQYATMMTLFNIGEAYQRTGEYYRALQYFQSIFPLYLPSFHDENILSNPESIEEYPFHIIKILLLYKARNLIFLSNEDTLNRLEYLKSASSCYDLVEKIIRRIETSINNYEVLLSFESLNANIMLEMAKNALQLYILTGDTHYFSIALNYIEKNKNMASIKGLNLFAENSLKIPEEIKQKRILLQDDYNVIKDLLFTSRDKNQLDSLDNLLLDKKIELDMFNWRASNKYPAFKDLNWPDISITLDDIQMKLKSKQALIIYAESYIDYILTPDEIITIAITKDDINYFMIDGPRLYELTTNFYNLISNNDQKSRIDSTGYLLASLLLEPIGKLIENKDLIIIPSQHISLVPFDALPEFSSDRNLMSYMIEDHSIWKSYSINSFLQEIALSQPTNVGILAIAPGFTKANKMQIAMLAKRDTSLINLSGALTECREINRYYNTKLLTGFNATEQEFKSLSGNYPLIHLSTHGVPDTFDETMVSLAFSNQNDTKEDGFLNMYEIFNLDLHADMIVLSACKTGVGQLNKGAGNLSLAWAFNRAGVQSSVISLWDANDYASSVIMPGFYRYLSKGNTKPEALRKAKLDFIKSSDEITSNPYFWAGFEYYGNDTGILLQQNKIPYWPLTGILCVIVLFLYFFLKVIKAPH
ncbi:MAG: hypothetical protein A2W85_18145 [Bacteroidetes bacterium GWF2_41_31]|nr:MAG: hypothetical protein A2W85_18145 [Bacteroidetes bacterium GWF2_41_31]